jgi:hypothetical protein
MDAITEFIKGVNERFRNPFLFAFSVSLVYYNWEIPLALFWQDQTGFQSIREFVKDYTPHFKEPFMVAVLYCILMPIIIEVVEIVRTTTNTIGGKLRLKVIAMGSVSGEEYARAINGLADRTMQYTNAINENQNLSTNLRQANTDLNDTKEKIINARKELGEKEELHNKRVLALENQIYENQAKAKKHYKDVIIILSEIDTSIAEVVGVAWSSYPAVQKLRQQKQKLMNEVGE